MVNPLAAAFNMFLGFISTLPEPFVNFLMLVAGLFITLGLVRIVLTH